MTDMTAGAALGERVRKAGTSFYSAMRILPEARREAMFAVYAFCREVDDIADEPAPEAEKRAGLAAWRRAVDGLYTGAAPASPLVAALGEAVAHYHLRREDFLAVIDGMEMDAEADIRAPALAELDLYCARVASAVGHLSVHVFGDESAEAHRVADALGRALQLTNILRDVAEDAGKGRLYLPREILLRHGIATDDPMEVLHDRRLPLVCRDVAVMALNYYREAEAAMAQCRHKAMRPAAVMKAVYRATLDRLIAADWRHPEEPVRVSKLLKLWLAFRHGLF